MNDTSKNKLNAAFRSLRKEGFIARQSFSCCGSCAGYELATAVSEMPEAKRARVKGVVFYTKQDAANLRWKPTSLFLAYGPLDTQAHGEIGLPTETVGAAVVQALNAAGLATRWDGTASAKIEVVLP